ncbi:hypothetical protein C8A01DRAFT_39148 [Parachaetomium inaequale]|uniref:Uncharacterized protein n=1 Tax=Parachaetomium inaequale TaxID=2588326 RepID=A0AAN6PDJ9_9PEZI|nr:hypothetical protein C8A01DRAFT_39148 [Parachaetomium inaequale]
MSTEPETPWARAIFRQESLEEGTDWLRYYADPVFRENMTDRGIGDHFQEWTQADKLAYAFLLQALEEMQASEAAQGRKQAGLGKPRAVAAGFGLSYEPRDPTATAVQITNNREDVQTTFIELQRTLGKFEFLIRKRWGKKKKLAERTKALQKAWPNMPASHRPDLHSIIEDRQQPREVFLMPYINLKDLVSGNTLLRLLNSRGRHEPCVFAQVDLERLQLATRSKKILQPYQLVVHKMDMSSSVLPPDALYGYVSLPTPRDARDVVIHREVAGSEGVLVLEVQARLLNFLTDFCREILHDKRAEIDDERIPEEPEPDPLPAHDETTDSIVWVALQAPYRTPHAAIDLHGMVDLAKAAADDAQMRLWTLRQDPGYFATAVVDFEQHSFEYILDVNRQHHADVDLPGKFFINKAVRKMVHEALRIALLWEVVASLLEQIVEQERRFLESAVQLEEDSPEYFDLLLRLRHTLDNMMLPDTMLRLASSS